VTTACARSRTVPEIDPVTSARAAPDPKKRLIETIEYSSHRQSLSTGHPPGKWKNNATRNWEYSRGNVTPPLSFSWGESATTRTGGGSCGSYADLEFEESMCGTIAEVRENLKAATLQLPSAILANLDSTNGGYPEHLASFMFPTRSCVGYLVVARARRVLRVAVLRLASASRKFGRIGLEETGLSGSARPKGRGKPEGVPA